MNFIFFEKHVTFIIKKNFTCLFSQIMKNETVKLEPISTFGLTQYSKW